MLGKIKLILAIYFFTGFFSFGQNGLYATKVNWTPNGRFLTVIDPPTGVGTQISTSSIFDWYVDAAGTAIDPYNNIYYVQVTNDMQTDFWLYGIDLGTGTVVSSALLPDPDVIHQMEFNCKDSSLYAIKVVWLPGVNERYLVKINPTTGVTTTISPSSIFDWYVTNGGTTIDPNTNTYYVQVTDNNQSNFWLYGIDLTSGTVTSSALLPDPDVIHQMEFNCKDSSLYAIKVNFSPNQRFLVKIDPSTGVATTLSSSSIFDWYINQGGTTIDPHNNIYYVRVGDNNLLNQSLCGIDLSTGNVVSNAPLPNPDVIHQMIFNQKCEIDLDFNYQYSCLGNTTEFYSASCSGSFEWDFDDPSSGTNNYSSSANPTHVFSDTGYYDVKLKLASCCNSDSIVKTVYVSSNNQIAMLPGDISICIGDTILLDVSVLNGPYYWQDSSSTPTFQVTDPGVYWISENVCNTVDTIVVTYDSFQNFDLGLDTTLCIGNIILDAGSSGASYLWQDGSSNQQFIAATPGLYSVYITDTLGCTASDTIEIFPGLISVDIGNDTIICAGSTLILEASISGGNYVWQDGTTNSTFSVDSTGIYNVQVESGFCSTTDTINILVDTPIADFTISDTIGCPPLESSFQDQSYSNLGILDWSWDFGDNSNSILQHPTHSYSTSGIFTVKLTVTSPNGCIHQHAKTIEIVIYDDPIAAFIAQPNPANVWEQILFTDESTSAISWSWSFNDSTFSTDQNPIHTYLNAGDYSVQLIANSAFCSDTIIQVITIDEELVYYIPNTFTPNGDELNNIFRPIFTSGYDPSNFKLLIINRRREVIFQSNDVSVGWDGTHKGRLVQDGTYIWVVEFKESFSEQIRIDKGHVNLLR